MLNEAIAKALKLTVHDPALLEVMEYAVFPAGKLFRPRLVEALGLDFERKVSSDHLHLASAIELHHAYTLVHDDLPSMDNDSMRRGKLSTHARFGEWKAILGGDALLISSFHELSRITHLKFRELHQLMLWTTGAKGLIEGQFKDLGADGNLRFEEIVRIHELKTGRLIQLATLGTYLLSPNTTFQGKKDFLRLGRDIGVSFQLLDDLSELTALEVSTHEKAINPFITAGPRALKEIKVTHLRIMEVISQYHLHNAGKMLQEYFEKNKKNLIENFAVIEKNIGEDPAYIKDWITSFA